MNTNAMTVILAIAIFILSVIFLVIWIWCIVATIRSNLSDTTKLILILLLIFLNVLGVIITLFTIRKENLPPSYGRNNEPGRTSSQSVIDEESDDTTAEINLEDETKQ